MKVNKKRIIFRCDIFSQRINVLMKRRRYSRRHKAPTRGRRLDVGWERVRKNEMKIMIKTSTRRLQERQPLNSGYILVS